MKTIIGVTLVVVVMGLVVQNYPQDVVEYNREVILEEPVVEEVKTPDVIEQARLELERINKELDQKEQELLEERKKIDAELERLRQTRVSFQ